MDDHTRLQAAGEIPLRTLELLNVLVQYDRAKARYQKRRATLAAEYPDRGTFLVRTRDDLLYREAVADCGWYSSEVQTLGTAVLALTAVTR
jgi:hypothetical protein